MSGHVFSIPFQFLSTALISAHVGSTSPFPRRPQRSPLSGTSCTNTYAGQILLQSLLLSPASCCHPTPVPPLHQKHVLYIVQLYANIYNVLCEEVSNIIKRIACLILVGILIVSCSVGFVTAGQTSLIGASGVDNNKEIIRQSALGQIAEYLQSDSQTKGKAIDLSDEFIDLCDIDGAVSGYMIPLMNMGKEIGYISVSVLDTKCIVQDIYIEGNALEKFKEKVSRAKGKQDRNTEYSRLLFVPPNGLHHRSRRIEREHRVFDAERGFHYPKCRRE